MANPYTINAILSAAYDDNSSEATLTFKDSTGVNVTSHKKMDSGNTEDILTEVLYDLVNKIVASASKKADSKQAEKDLAKENERLMKELNALKVDNKVLSQRLNSIMNAQKPKPAAAPVKGDKVDVKVKCGTPKPKPLSEKTCDEIPRKRVKDAYEFDDIEDAISKRYAKLYRMLAGF